MTGPGKAALAALFLLMAAPVAAAAGPPAAGQPAKGPVDHRGPLRNLPEGREILYMPEKYAACIPCHPRPVFEDEDFNVDTYFRDTRLGKNLHWMHVFRQPQGTNCSACHRADEATGKLAFPPELKIELRNDGASCSPPCHRPKQYRNAGRPARQ